ncbi:MAG: AraC family transcriptional regulator [Bacteroidales bacterium]|nr:AraC family transcriptional regulator [Bacteroidales bacterium]
MSTNVSKYLLINPNDMLWGLSVNCVGSQEISPGQAYPPLNHPSQYRFNPRSGRVLDEFQIVYITSGSGYFSSEALGRKRVHISQGDAFLLFPGEWHSYAPSKEGWKEFWIGYNGDLAHRWLQSGLIRKDAPILTPGVSVEMVHLYQRAKEIAQTQKAGYQPLLTSIAFHLLCLVLYNARNRSFDSDGSYDFIQKVRVEVSEHLDSVTPESLAKSLCISYSKFRKLLKQYTGIAPGQYIQQMRMSRAQDLLIRSDKQIKEIAWELGYDNPDYFVTVFRTVVGMTPTAYRNKNQQE